MGGGGWGVWGVGVGVEGGWRTEGAWHGLSWSKYIWCVAQAGLE